MSGFPGGSGGPSTSSSGPPPLPPRPVTSDNSALHPSTLNPYGMGYNSISGPYGGGLGMYGGGYGTGLYGGGLYGGGGGMYGQYGYGYGPAGGESQFTRFAEESSRGAFQSIESVVMAVSSVANMLSSTHNAVYSSFRAVIGVVEQFGRLKTQLGAAIASLALWRFVKRLWRYLLVFLRLKPKNYASAAEMAWGEISSDPTGAEYLAGHGAKGGATNWPALVFWVVALGGPWLIYMCLQRMVQGVEESRKWATGTGAHYQAKALYDFQATSDQELSLMAGETLRVAPKELQPKVRGWLLASCAEGDRIGLVPINYIQLLGRKSESPPPVAHENRDLFENFYKPRNPQRNPF